jgi:hypothetical protein
VRVVRVGVFVGLLVGVPVLWGVPIGVSVGVFAGILVGVGVETPTPVGVVVSVGVLVGAVGTGVQGGTETPTVVQVVPPDGPGSKTQSRSTTSDMPKMQAGAVSDTLPVQVSVAEPCGPSVVTGLPPW